MFGSLIIMWPTKWNETMIFTGWFICDSFSLGVISPLLEASRTYIVILLTPVSCEMKQDRVNKMIRYIISETRSQHTHTHDFSCEDTDTEILAKMSNTNNSTYLKIIPTEVRIVYLVFLILVLDSSPSHLYCGVLVVSQWRCGIWVGIFGQLMLKSILGISFELVYHPS